MSSAFFPDLSAVTKPVEEESKPKSMSLGEFYKCAAVVADKFPSPMTTEWAMRSGILRLGFEGKVEKVQVATDAMHAIRQLDFKDAPTTLLNFCSTTSFSDDSYRIMRHVWHYLEGLSEHGIIAASGKMAILPYTPRDAKTRDAVKFFKLNLEDRKYSINKTSLDKCFVESIRPAPLDGFGNPLLSVNIMNGYQMYAGYNRLDLTRGVEKLLRTTYPSVPLE